MREETLASTAHVQMPVLFRCRVANTSRGERAMNSKMESYRMTQRDVEKLLKECHDHLDKKLENQGKTIQADRPKHL